MTTDLPQYFFRVRDTGALVFRLDDGTRERRLEMDPIAVVNLRKDEIRPQGDRALDAADEAVIRAWMATRRDLLDRRDTEDALRLAERLNLAAHWAQTRASPEQVEAVTETLLLAMHDLRGVLVRRRSEALVPRP